MAAKVSQSLQFSTWIDSEKIVRKPIYSLQFSTRFREQQRVQILISSSLQPRKAATYHRPVALKVSCSPQNFEGSL